MTSENGKRAAARAALAYVEADAIVGIGTGSTVDHFIDALGENPGRLRGAVSSSEATTARLRALRIPVYDLNAVDGVPVYVDGADEVNRHLQMIKGGGGALTREKILAAVAERFVCVVDAGKQVIALGNFPLAVELIPMARGLVARELVRLGGRPRLREGFTTDNGNIIIDVEGLDFGKPIALEQTLNNITGVVTAGLFAKRRADVLLVGSDDGVDTVTA